jgi:CRISPR-associated protein (TIGR03986 family)
MANHTSNRRPAHTNPTNPRRRARAPYNFVPLPENIVLAVEEDKDKEKKWLLDQDRYYDDRHTGWFDCELETCSPVYVRGMMTLDQYKKADEKKDLTVEEKLERAPFYSYQQKDGQPAPVIPGSSLRGMLRALVEIIGYGKMKWVNKSPSITYRAVAAAREDPLAEPYRRVIGQFSSNIRAGYLEKTDNGQWRIWPALTPQQMGWPDRGAFLKVREKNIPPDAIKDFYYFDDPGYLPEYFSVTFNVENRRNKFGQYSEVVKISSEDRYQNKGAFIVCTGNMLETGRADQKSPRRNHIIILHEDENADPIDLSDKLVEDYLNSLTPFQQEDLWGKENGRPTGVLEDGAPVFYVLDKKARSPEVLWFGHPPNFRIPARTADGKVTTPVDLIPDYIRTAPEPDLAEAIFGWVEEKGGLKEQRAGRVFVTDANFIEAKNEIWLARKNAITPATLGSPKVTTFQHYLVQDKNEGHDPDFRQKLAHYDAEFSKTEIRGHKLYWHKGRRPNIEATTEQRKKESQLTRIEPLQPGVRFRFRVHFENLKNEELGALAWALALPGEAGRTYCHKLGMGKPLGMGAVAIRADLFVTNRRQRYQALFNQSQFEQAVQADDARRFVEDFEAFILPKLAVTPRPKRLAEVRRIRMLLAMLQWREGSKEWLDLTRYQLIEHPKFDNEYKERPVLPDPMMVSSYDKAVSSPPTTSGKKEPVSTQAAQPPTPKPSPSVVHQGEEIGTVEDFGLGIHKNTGVIKNEKSSEQIIFHFSQLTFDSEKLAKYQSVAYKRRPGGIDGFEAYEVRLPGEATEPKKER